MVCGPVMIDVAGQELTPEDAELLAHPAVGAVILFTRNYRSPQQLRELVDSMRRCRETPLLVTVDQEGGRVQRFREGFSPLPPFAAIGARYEEAPADGLRLAEFSGWVMARELRDHGLDLSFSPVVDLDHGLSEIIGNRAFHDDPEVVARLARALITGMHAGGMAACAKHFPGHGGVAPDSHVALPVDERSLEDISAWDMVPFTRLCKMDLPAVMMAHVVYPAVDSLPASFSRRWVRDVLRHELNFAGAVIADDLCMAAAARYGNPGDRARAALEAGCDLMPVCNDRAAAVAVIDAVGAQERPASRVRLERLLGGEPLDTCHNISGSWDEARRLVATSAGPG